MRYAKSKCGLTRGSEMNMQKTIRTFSKHILPTAGKPQTASEIRDNATEAVLNCIPETECYVLVVAIAKGDSYIKQ
ncbi:hypothetical protein DPMN_141497 [Dreissena polymorpha]|uniref:Uncharacterized protein n=1 Tax=Dreissena polymorpha TaxID=45954 RepID=A0A9D4JLB4_DREPO|nr:hypothetical protein DPMN_141497 [Dreissena polymorpha]